MTRGGATLLGADGRATHYAEEDGLPFGSVRSVARTDDGAVWLAAVGGLARLADGRWQRVRDDWNYPGRSATVLFVDRAGGLWLGGATPDALHFLPKGSRRFELAAAGLAAASITEATDGTVLVGDGAQPFLHDVRPRGDGGYDVRVVADLASRQGRRRSRGRRVGGGVRPLAADPARSNGPVGGSAARSTSTTFRRPTACQAAWREDVLVDREGNTWVATDAGLDRLRRRNLTWTQPGTTRSRPASWPVPDSTLGPVVEQPAFGAFRTGVPFPMPPKDVTWGFRRSPTARSWSAEGRLWRWRDGSFSPIAPPAEVSARRMQLRRARGDGGSVGPPVGLGQRHRAVPSRRRHLDVRAGAARPSRSDRPCRAHRRRRPGLARLPRQPRGHRRQPNRASSRRARSASGRSAPSAAVPDCSGSAAKRAWPCSATTGSWSLRQADGTSTARIGQQPRRPPRSTGSG